MAALFESYTDAGIHVRFIHVQGGAFTPSYLFSIFKYRYHIVAITEGEVELLNHQEVVIARHSEVWVMPEGFYIRPAKPNVKFWLLRFTEHYAKAAAYNSDAALCRVLNNEYLQCLKADTFSFEVIVKLMMLLHKHHHYRSSPNSEIICRLTFNLLLQCLDELTAFPRSPVKNSVKRKELITIEFLRLAEKEAKVHHDVHYYADRLCMTQGNLTKIIREVTDKAPKAHIEEILVGMAQEMLDHSISPVYSVAEELNFKSSSTFINFFRNRTGMTPNEYRNRKTQ